MRDITFLEVGMENYGPYIDPMVLPFNNDTLTLLVGPNGIGKTMALEALTFTLYGMTSKGQKGDDVVNDVVGKNCHTWTTFKANDDLYQVDRYHKYTKLGNTVILKQNGVDIKKGSKEVIPEIEKLILPRKLFTNTLMFGQKVKDFFTDLVDSDKKEIFRMILNLSIYQKLYKITDDRIKNVTESIQELGTKTKVNEGLLQDTNDQLALLDKQRQTYEYDKLKQIKELETKIKDNERLNTNWNETLESLNKLDGDTEEIKEQLQAVRNSLSTLSDKKNRLTRDLENQRDLKNSEIEKRASQAMNGINEEYHSTKSEASESHSSESKKVLSDIGELEKLRSSIKSNISGVASTILMTNKQKEEFEESLNSDDAICPTCLQDMDEECQSNLQEQIDDLSDSETQYDEQMKIHHNDLERYEKEIAVLNTKLTDVLLRDYNLELEQLNKIKKENTDNINTRVEVAIHQVELLSLEKEKGIGEQISGDKKFLEEEESELSQELEKREKVATSKRDAEEAIKSLENQQNYNNQLLETAKESEFDKTQINNYLGRMVNLQNEQDVMLRASTMFNRRLVILDFWKKAYSSSGIPSILIDEAIPFMNERISEYLEKLTNGRYIVSFDTLDATKGGEFRDKISVNVLDTITHANSRIKLSGGQTRIIDIATILTLRDLQSNVQDVNFNILIFDEIFDSLDEENIGFVSKVLAQLKLGKSIYLISHQHQDQLEADETLELR